MKKSIQGIESKKGIHVSINESSHSEFRIQCFKYSLSMQEVIEEFVVRVANEDQDVLDILKELKSEKKSKTVKRLKSSDIDSIYDIINAQHPLSDD